MMQIPNGHYTIQNVENGDHRSFKVKTQKENAKFAPGDRVVGLLAGHDNERDYERFAFIRNDSGGDYIQTWRRYVGVGRKTRYEYFTMLLEAAIKSLETDEDKDGCAMFKVQVAGKEREYMVVLAKHCFKCNRLLTTPESIAAGIGPECAKGDKW
jgi:hypothetical protein